MACTEASVPTPPTRRGHLAGEHPEARGRLQGACQGLRQQGYGLPGTPGPGDPERRRRAGAAPCVGRHAGRGGDRRRVGSWPGHAGTATAAAASRLTSRARTAKDVRFCPCLSVQEVHVSLPALSSPACSPACP